MTARTTGAAEDGARGAEAGPDDTAPPMGVEGKAETVTLAHHWTDRDGKSYSPGQKAKVDPDTAGGLRAAGYLVREDDATS